MNNGKICVSVAAETADEMIAKIKQAEEFADVIEVRFDNLEKSDLEILCSKMSGPSNRIIDSTNLPIISTFRPKDQGGYRDIDVEERSNFWNGGFETDYCDVEEEFVDDSWNWLWGERICSYHDFSRVPADVEAIANRLLSTDAERIKIAVQAEDVTDAIPVWKLINHARPYGELSPQRVIPIAMGDAGKWTRIMGLAHGAFMTYASLETGAETAPGQVSAKDMVEVYRVRELDKNTQVFGVIGDPISQSVSPYMHNPAFVEGGINAVFIPLLVKDLDEFIRRMVKPKTREVELNFGGFSVTMPHKQAIMRHLDAIDPTANAIGAVNTVKISDGKLTGYNTDAHGFITPLKAKFGDVRDARVAVFGAGGASRACVYALKQEGADVTVFARDSSKVEAFANEFGVGFSQILNLKSEISNLKSQISDLKFQMPDLGSSFDILVDATPLGMKGPQESDSLFAADQLDGLKFVYDLVTKPTDTPIIREAKKAGVPTLGGLEMLIAQGAKQFEIWTGETPPVELMRDSLMARMAK